MLAGRPTNLWLGLVTAIGGLVTSALVVAGVDPAVVASLVGPAMTVLGASIILIANQPPTLAPGDTFKVETPAGQPNYTTTVAQPPAQDPPPVPTEPTPLTQ